MVLFHEISHVVAAYATGGSVFGIAIDPGAASMTLGMGGNETIIVAASYAGSLLIGCAILALSALWKPAEVWACLAILCCASLGFGWLNEFTMIFGYGCIFLMIAGWFILAEEVMLFFLRLIGASSCLYPVIDAVGEIAAGASTGFKIQGKIAGSDLARLSELLDVSQTAIATVWCGGALIVLFLMTTWAAGADARLTIKQSVLETWRRRKELQALRDFADPLYDRNDPQSGRSYRIR